MHKAGPKLEQLLHGQKWAAVYARRSLPVLVKFVEQHKGKPDSEIPAFTYGTLASALGQPSHYRKLGIKGDFVTKYEEILPSADTPA